MPYLNLRLLNLLAGPSLVPLAAIAALRLDSAFHPNSQQPHDLYRLVQPLDTSLDAARRQCNSSCPSVVDLGAKQAVIIQLISR